MAPVPGGSATAPTPTLAENSPLTSVVAPEPVEPKGGPAPLQEIERIIEVLARDVGQRPEPRPGEPDVPRHGAAGPGLPRHPCRRDRRRFQVRPGDPPLATLEEWLAWIESRNPINADDRRHLANRLKFLSPAKLANTCRWYAQTWAKAAATEPVSYRQENAGRKAVNASLVAPRTATLTKATHPPRQQQSRHRQACA